MKALMFAAAMAVSVPAMAQDSSQPTPPPADVSAPPAAPGDSTMMAPGSTAQPTDSTMPATQPDATGGAMTTQSDPGANSGTMSNGSMSNGSMSNGSMSGATGMANAPAAGDPSTYPVCSKTVKDRCISRSASTKSKRRGR